MAAATVQGYSKYLSRTARLAMGGRARGAGLVGGPPLPLLLPPLIAFAVLHRLPAGQAGMVPSLGVPDVYGCGVPPPLCPNENITFWLYTRREEQPQLLDSADPASLQQARYASGSFKILIHGYTGHRDYSPNTEIRPAYLEHGDYNVISVDWGPLASEPCYVHAAYSVATVGNCTAQLLDTLVAEGVASLEALHVIGFSLGGQAASQVAVFLRTGPLPRLTGLDPALPLFASSYKSTKLDSSDAEFVDVIHTNSGNKGKYEPCGHVDFYVNGGFNQPGCTTHRYGEASCSHERAPVYFAESISSEKGFWGRSCCSWFMKLIGWCNDDESDMQLMGEFTPHSARGAYYVRTAEEPPFALGKEDNACES